MSENSQVNIDKTKKIRLFLIVITIISFIIFGGYFLSTLYFKKIKSTEEQELNLLSGIANTLGSIIDGDIHNKLVNIYDEKDAIFSNEQDSIYLSIHKLLRAARDKNQLATDIYTLVLKNGINTIDLYEASFFAVTSSDNPYYRHPYTPSEIMVRNYETGGIIPPYKDENDVWLTAFSPIKDSNGNTVAIVLADLKFDEFISKARKDVIKEMTIVGIIALLIIALIIFSINWISGGLIVEQIKLSNQFENLNQTYKKVAQFIDIIAKGDLNTKFSLEGENAILEDSLIGMQKSLKEAAEETAKRKIEDDRQNWATKGHANFANILRQNNDDMEKFSYEIISNLVQYLEANQGGIFILNDENEGDIFYEQTATYAYDRQKFIERRIEFGEGLIGSSIQETETIYMTDIPDKYIAITSGLGKSNPSCLLIIPLAFNEETFGAIELASFKEIEKYQIVFVEEVAKSIASTIASVKINLRTAALLEDSKSQAQEMAAKEEEMRQNMEELQATQEEMDRIKKEEAQKQQEFLDANEKQRSVLTRILDKVPEKIFLKNRDGKMLLVNEAVSKTHGVKPEELLGKSDFDFFDKKHAEKLYQDELDIMNSEEKTWTQEERLSGELKILQTTKMPFYIDYLEETGLLGVQTDITELEGMKKQRDEFEKEIKKLKEEIKKLKK